MGLRRRLSLPSELALLGLLSVLVGATACGEELAGFADGSVDSGTLDSGTTARAPAAPEPPALPDFGVCPDGWRAVATDDGFDVCEPFPEGGRPACARDEGYFPGAPGCALIGTPCPRGDFPVDLPTGTPVLYVLAGAAGGDGAEASPFGTIGEALAVAAPGVVIAVGKGRYSEVLAISDGVSLVGACVAETVITSDTGSYSRGVLDVVGADVVIRNLRIADAARAGITIIGAGHSAFVEDVVIHDCAVAGISVEADGALTAERIVARDIRSVAALNALGRGLNVETGAVATVRWLHVERAKEFAVLVMREGDLTLEDATITDTQLPSSTGLTGSGLVAAEDGHLTARRVVVDEATMVAVLVQQANSEAFLEDLVIRRTRPGPVVGGARGIEAAEQGALECTRCLIEDLLEGGLISNSHSSVALTDCLIRRVGPRRDDERMGRAISAQGGAAVRVVRVVATDLRDHAVIASGEGSRVTGEDLLIRRVTGEESTGEFGRGLTTERGAVMDLARVEIGEVTEAGLAVREGGSAVVTDVYVHDVRPRTLDGRHGRGVSVEVAAGLMEHRVEVTSKLTLLRARVEGVAEFGVGVLGFGATLTATDLVIDDVTPQACPDWTCTEAPGGHGIGTYFGSVGAVERFDVANSSLCGVHIANAATLRMGDGIVQRALIGACLQSENQAIADIQDRVRYVDNGTNLEATMLPLPALLSGVD